MEFNLREVFCYEHGKQLDFLEEYAERHVSDFLKVAEGHPLKRHHQSYVSLSEAFWLYRLTVDLLPDNVVESGTFHGYSAWWFAMGLKKVFESYKSKLMTFTVTTIDPTCEPHNDIRASIHKICGWRHFSEDFSGLGNDRLRPEVWSTRDIAFFDDHQDQRARLDYSRSLGFRHHVFHDVYQHTSRGGHSSLWRDGVGGEAAVLQFPVIRSPYNFQLPEAAGHSWLTYVRDLA